MEPLGSSRNRRKDSRSARFWQSVWMLKLFGGRQTVPEFASERSHRSFPFPACFGDMTPLPPIQKGLRGFSLIEILVTTAVLGSIMGGLTVGVMALQRSFYASRDFAAAHAEQVRVCDYLQRDGRSATEIQITEEGRTVTMKIPTENGGLIGLNLPESLISILGGGTPPETKTVVYRFAGSEMVRNDGVTRRIIASRLS